MNPFSASDEFGFHTGFSLPAASSTGEGSEPASALQRVETQVSGAWYQHPDVAVFGIVLLAAGLLGHATKPVASGGVKGSVGPAKGSIEGSI